MQTVDGWKKLTQIKIHSNGNCEVEYAQFNCQSIRKLNERKRKIKIIILERQLITRRVSERVSIVCLCFLFSTNKPLCTWKKKKIVYRKFPSDCMHSIVFDWSWNCHGREHTRHRCRSAVTQKTKPGNLVYTYEQHWPCHSVSMSTSSTSSSSSSRHLERRTLESTSAWWWFVNGYILRISCDFCRFIDFVFFSA